MQINRAQVAKELHIFQFIFNCNLLQDKGSSLVFFLEITLYQAVLHIEIPLKFNTTLLSATHA